MAYEIDVDPDAQDQIRALPASLLIALAEALTMLEVAPWNGAPQHAENPTVRCGR